MFSEVLSAAADDGEVHGEGLELRAATDSAVIRSAPRGSAHGLSGLRTEHLWALPDSELDSLVGVVLQLASKAGVDQVPAVATNVRANANLLLLESGGPQTSRGSRR